MAASGLLLLSLVPWVRPVTHNLLIIGDIDVLASYYEAAGFALHLVGISSLSSGLESVLSPATRLIR